ncbi:carboxylesterase/lipase family protein [Novosphingobium sp. 9]|uniref:carboxylesterase/lipase family protein n=1 Tax=Novosphingobium sp. 9 TaxID=2025349 RepID=UPI0021B6D5D3|nr:carboxylesterase family protein [Novosphingobium sp. 9]
MIRKLSLTLLAATTLCAGASVEAAPKAPTVKVQQGVLSGTVDQGITSFKGIPYAAPPVGPLRWRAPQAPAHWQGVRRADRFGFICTQPDIPGGPGLPQSEDCLTLNVWKPSAPAKGKRPVMLWIHGGGSFMGAGSDPLYDGSALAREGVVVVSINYRLGALGYFVHPALSGAAADVKADGGMLANYGLMDQLAAMRWVKRNIAAFGGDPANVTIFGESAGGCYVDMWMTSPVARGLFARAITESCPGFIESRTMAEGTQRGEALARALGVEGAGPEALARLRALPAADFVTRAAIKGTYPFIDGKIVPEDPFRAAQAGHAARVPWLIGSNSFDASYLPYFGVDISKPLAAYTPADQSRILAAYTPPGADDVAKHRAPMAFLSDMVMGASDRLFATQAAAVGAPTWIYSFRYEGSATKPDSLGVPHGGELPYVFGNAGQGIALVSAKDHAVSSEVRRVWTDFAKGRLPLAQSWSSARRTLVFGTDGTLSTPQDYHRARLDLATPFARDNAGRWDP